MKHTHVDLCTFVCSVYTDKKDTGIRKELLQEDYTNTMVSESNQQELLQRRSAKELYSTVCLKKHPQHF